MSADEPVSPMDVVPIGWSGPACVFAAYVFGSISFGLLVAKQRGVDLRAEGSGNIGATNVGRVLGGKAFVLVFVLDALKAVLPLAATRALFGVESWEFAATGFAAVLGHVLPVWHGFKGGKGVATTFGVLAVTSVWALLAAALIYALVRRATRLASLGSLAAIFVGAGAIGFEFRATPPTWMAIALLVLVVGRHADNIQRLVRGEELPP